MLNSAENFVAFTNFRKVGNNIIEVYDMEFNDIYEFSTYNGIFQNNDLIEELSSLYSQHYGVWDNKNSDKEGRVKLSPRRLKEDFISPSSCVVTARQKESKILVGYAIAIKAKNKNKNISWVTQFVVHTDHRNKKVGQMLLYSLWGESHLDAWGIVTANPYAIRALEKATHRRCALQAIKKQETWLFNFACDNISYITQETELDISDFGSKIYTKFFVDHSSVPEKIQNVTRENLPWILGSLDPGWEWFAFTFKQQELFPLTSEEMQLMLDTSDEVTKQAYAKMDISSHPWAQYTEDEINYILSNIHLEKNAKILDLGCGNGRHSIALAQKGYNVTAIDYNCYNESIRKIPRLRFITRDIRDIKKDSLPKDFNLILCLYDVIGTYADNIQNIKIIKEIHDHLAPGGIAFISVMNIDYLFARCPQYKDVGDNFNILLSLEAQNIMQTTGDVFDNTKIIIDRATNICYRKEQFSGSEDDIFREFIVRDRRYTDSEISSMLSNIGFSILDKRFVRAGKWRMPLEKSQGKEILLICQKKIQ